MFYSFIVRLLNPLLLLFLVTALALFALWRRREKGCWRWLLVLTIAYIALYLFFTPAVSFLSIGSLEWGYPPTAARPGDAQAIVVLSSGVCRWYASGRREAVMDIHGIYRCRHAADIYFAGPKCPILVTGGKVDPASPEPLLADVMRDYLIEQGVPQEDILVEREARSTYENALHSAKLLGQHKINTVVLVTDAVHMNRSVRCFEAQGIHVTPSGCYFRAAEFEWSLFAFLPSANAASGNQDAFHEWIGLFWYWLTGKFCQTSLA